MPDRLPARIHGTLVPQGASAVSRGGSGAVLPQRSRTTPLWRRACTAAASWTALAIAAPLAGLAGGLAPRVLLGVVLLDIPLQLNVNLAFREDADEFGGLGGYELSVTTVALVLLYLRWAILSVTARASERPPAARVSRPLACYLGFAALSAVGAADVALSLRELFLLVQVFLIFVYIVSWVRTRDEVRYLMSALLSGLALESLIMLYALHRGESWAVPGLRIRVDSIADVVRVAGTVGSPNSAAAYLSLLIAPALAVLMTKARLSLKALAIFSAGLAAVALIPTQSRGGWLATLLSLVLLWFATARRSLRSLAIPVAAAVLILLVVAVSRGTIVERLQGDDGGSAQGRLPLMYTAAEMIRDHPLLGVGPNNYSTVMKHYGAVYGDWGDWVFTVHNKFFLVWAESGLGGLISFIWFLAATIRQGWKGWKVGDPWLSPLALGFTGALVGHVVHLQVDLFSARPQVEMLWVVAALVAVIYAAAENPDHSTGEAGGALSPGRIRHG